MSRYRTSTRIALLLCAAAGLAQAESPEYLGAASCSARACHGGVGAGRQHPMVWGNEHTIWVEHDSHRHAYAALVSPRGQAIAQRLGLRPAQQAQECLGCHAPAALGIPEQPAPCTPTFVTEGVGCETCHGPAGGWIAAHTAADWNLLSPVEKDRNFAFRNTKDLAARAQLCSECHVGSARGDVNHDLIAAGHPRLTFEFASHLHRLPLHWDEKGENDRRLHPAFEAHVWTIGQIIAAKAQLELLVARAESSVWPEFAEYSCYGCHRSLKPELAAPTGSLGQPVWGTWHFPLLSLVDQRPANPHLAALSEIMSKLTADQSMAIDAARAGLQKLDAAPSDPNEFQIREQLASFADKGPSLINGEWDIAAQLYLALAAWQQARLDVQQSLTAEDRAIQRLLGEARRDLRAPPADFSSARSATFVDRLRDARRSGLLVPAVQRP